MASDKTPIRQTYRCQVVGSDVVLTGVTSRLRGGPQPFAVAVASRYTACSESPGCGFMLSGPGCPFKQPA
jgi:hypothetical protein